MIMETAPTIDLSHRHVAELDFSEHLYKSTKAQTKTTSSPQRTVIYSDDDDNNDHSGSNDLTSKERDLLSKTMVLIAHHNSISRLKGLQIFSRLTILDLSHNRLYIPSIRMKHPAAATANMSPSDQPRSGGRKIVLDSSQTLPSDRKSFILVGGRPAGEKSNLSSNNNNSNIGNGSSTAQGSPQQNDLWWITELPPSLVSLNLSHNEIAVEIDGDYGNSSVSSTKYDLLLEGWVASTFLRHLTSLRVLDLSHNYICTPVSGGHKSTASSAPRGSSPVVWNPHTGYPHLPPSTEPPMLSSLETLSLAHNVGVVEVGNALLSGLDALTELHLEGTGVRESATTQTRPSPQHPRSVSTIDVSSVANCLPCLVALHLKMTPLAIASQETSRRFRNELESAGVHGLSLDLPLSGSAQAPSSNKSLHHPNVSFKDEPQSIPSSPSSNKDKVSNKKHVKGGGSSRDISVKPATFVIAPRESSSSDEEASPTSTLEESDESDSTTSLTSHDGSFEFAEEEPESVGSASDEDNNLSQEWEAGAAAEQRVLELLLKSKEGAAASRQHNEASSLGRRVTQSTDDASESRASGYHNAAANEENALLGKAADLERLILDAKARVFALRQLSAEQEESIKATRRNVCDDLKIMSELKTAVATLRVAHQERTHVLTKRQRELKHVIVTANRFREKLILQEQLKVDKKMERAQQRQRGLESLREGRRWEQSGGLNLSRFSSGSPRGASTSASPKNRVEGESKLPKRNHVGATSPSQANISSGARGPSSRFVYDEFGNPAHNPSPSRQRDHHTSPLSHTAPTAYTSAPLKGNASGTPVRSGGIASPAPTDYDDVNTTTQIETSHLEDYTSPQTPIDARSGVTDHNVRSPLSDSSIISHHGGASSGGQADDSMLSEGRAASYAEVFNATSSMQPDFPQPSERLEDPARRIRSESARKTFQQASTVLSQMGGQTREYNNNNSNNTRVVEASSVLNGMKSGHPLTTPHQRLDLSQREKAPYYRHSIQAHPVVNSSQNTIMTKSPHGGSKSFSLRSVLLDAENISRHSDPAADQFPLTTAALGGTRQIQANGNRIRVHSLHQQERANSVSIRKVGEGGGRVLKPKSVSSGNLLEESRELLQMLSRSLYHSASGPEAGTTAAVGGKFRSSGTPDIRGQFGDSSTHRPPGPPTPRIAATSASHTSQRHLDDARRLGGSMGGDGGMVLEKPVIARGAPRLQ